MTAQLVENQGTQSMKRSLLGMGTGYKQTLRCGAICAMGCRYDDTATIDGAHDTASSMAFFFLRFFYVSACA